MERGKSGAYRSTHFIELRPEIDEILLKIISVCKNKDDSILDLGCNSGRHLNYLYNHGYKNLNGVDIMKSALDTFDKLFLIVLKLQTKA